MSEQPSNQPVIERASTRDFAELKLLLNKANDYSKERSGLPVWTAMDHTHSEFSGQIERGECFVIRDASGAITSAIVLNDHTVVWHDPDNKSAFTFINL